MDGKAKCRMLKEIRARIAEENDIAMVVSECTHQGKCRGTCPKCEAELAWLEAELEKRRSLHKRVAVAGVSLGMALSMTACDVDLDDLKELFVPTPTPEEIELDGDVSIDRYELVGEIDGEPLYMEQFPLMGAIYDPADTTDEVNAEESDE